MLTYPFVLVSNIMAVNNCGWVAASPPPVVVSSSARHVTYNTRLFARRLAGGLPPYASVYPTWVDCWRHLSREVSTRHRRCSVVHCGGWTQRYNRFTLCSHKNRDSMGEVRDIRHLVCCCVVCWQFISLVHISLVWTKDMNCLKRKNTPIFLCV